MIKLAVIDVDGVLSDGGYYVPSHTRIETGVPNNFYLRKLNTKDFVGMKLIHDAGVRCIIVSGSREPCIQHINYLNPYITVADNVQDKYDWVETFIKHSKGMYSWEEISAIGDEINDAKLLENVGMAACPSDAVPEIIDIVSNRKDGFVMSKKGGDGCVREFTDLIRSMQRIPAKWVNWEKKYE